MSFTLTRSAGAGGASMPAVARQGLPRPGLLQRFHAGRRGARSAALVSAWSASFQDLIDLLKGKSARGRSASVLRCSKCLRKVDGIYQYLSRILCFTSQLVERLVLLVRSTKKSPSVSMTALRALRNLVERAPHTLHVGKVILRDFATFLTLLKLMQRNSESVLSLVSLDLPACHQMFLRCTLRVDRKQTPTKEKYPLHVRCI